MKRQKIIIVFIAFTGVMLIASPMIWAKKDPSGVPFQALWDAISELQDQIDAIDLVPGPPGESGITEVLTQFHYLSDYYSPITSSVIPYTDFQFSISEPSDIVVLFTSEIIPPSVSPIETWGGVMIMVEYQRVGAPFGTLHRSYGFTGNGAMVKWEKGWGVQANIHSVISLSDPGDYEVRLSWHHFNEDNVQDWSWQMRYVEMTLLVN